MSIVRRATVPAAALLVISYFGSAAIASDNGVLALSGYVEDLDGRSVELAQLEARRDRLKLHAELLDPDAADPDLAEELVRRELGLVAADEVIIPLD